MDKRLIIYAVIIVICLISLGIGVYTQFFYKDVETNPFMLGNVVPVDNNKIEEDEKAEEAKNAFDSLFINAVTYTSANFNNSVTRKEITKDLVYTSNELDGDDMIKTYASIYEENDGVLKLTPIEDEKEWALVEKLIDQATDEESKEE